MFKTIYELQAKKARGEKGFTLIELLIVVAIIGILAAIAIPQFAAYRIRGFNASASSDVRNAATAQEALFADTAAYGSTASAVLGGAACAAPGAMLTGPLNGATALAGGQVRNALGAVGNSVGNNVSLATNTAAAAITVAPIVCTTYVLVSKHVNGDRCYGRDSDSQAMLTANKATGVALAAADVPAGTVGAIEVTGTTGACAAWVVM